MGVLILLGDRSQWLVGVAAIVLFGLCAIVFGWMLIARRPDASPR